MHKFRTAVTSRREGARCPQLLVPCGLLSLEVESRVLAFPWSSHPCVCQGQCLATDSGGVCAQACV